MMDMWAQNRGKEGYAATVFRGLCYKHDLHVVDTYHRIGPTYYTAKNRKEITSNIDHGLMSRGAAPAVTNVVAIKGLMRTLQAPKMQRPEDHCPRMVEMIYRRKGREEREKRKIR